MHFARLWLEGIPLVFIQSMSPVLQSSGPVMVMHMSSVSDAGMYVLVAVLSTCVLGIQ